MKGSLHSATVLFIILVSILLPFCSCDLIDTTCSRTPDPKLCLSLLRSNLKSPGADITGLSLILVDVVKNKSISAVDIMKKLQKSKPELKKALKDCKGKYEFIGKDMVNVAVEALTKGDPKFAVDSMNDSAIEAEICESDFEKEPSPLTSVNNDMIDTARVTSAVIRNLL